MALACSMFDASVPPPPSFSFKEARSQRMGRRLCALSCACCDPMGNSLDLSEKRRRTIPADVVVESSTTNNVASTAVPTFKSVAPYVDTHCHLEEVLALIQLHTAVPSVNKFPHELTYEERRHWETIGWLKKTQPTSKDNPTWDFTWEELSTVQREAALLLGWTAESWNSREWPLTRKVSWSKLLDESKNALVELGETAESWDAWNVDFASISAGRNIAKLNTIEGSPGVKISISQDTRKWSQLTSEQREAAIALSFTEGIWNQVDMGDVGIAIHHWFGPGFEGCVTQGCDVDSVDVAQKLALTHPRIFAAFGCHPKGAWLYDDAFEARLLAAVKACGPKAVAWGEFGLDYSHPEYGKQASNRRLQREVFVRQLRLAIRHEFPLVIHCREADKDMLRLLRKWVPRSWRVHLHSHRGGSHVLQEILEGWDNLYIGFAGIVTMGDPDAEELVRQCPLSRMLLETDSPYLPLSDSFFSHPGQLHVVAVKVAELKGEDLSVVLETTRKNAKHMYGV